MPSDFAPIRSILAAEREQGRPFSKAWKVALEAVEDRERRQVLRYSSSGRGIRAEMRAADGLPPHG